MRVSREINIPMEGITINEPEKFTARHCNHFFGSSETTIISHDATDQAGAQ
jgi:hypothetical protein